MNKTNEVTAPDAHVVAWDEYREVLLGLNNWLALDDDEYRRRTGCSGRVGDDDDEVYGALVDRLSELTDLILVTPARSFAGARIQMELVREEFGEPPGTPVDAGGKALQQLQRFMGEVESALERHGRLAEVEAWMQDNDAPPAAA